jgi:hypothetical protein
MADLVDIAALLLMMSRSGGVKAPKTRARPAPRTRNPRKSNKQEANLRSARERAKDLSQDQLRDFAHLAVLDACKNNPTIVPVELAGFESHIIASVVSELIQK